MSKTVKELADELGVSRQRIQQIISKQVASKRPKKVAGQYQLDDSFCDLISKQIKAKNSTSSKQTSTSSKQENANNRQESASSKQILEVFKTQLSKKDEQIEHLQKLLDQSQQLQLIAENKIKQLEVPKEENKKEASEKETPEVKQEEPKKRPWWRF